MIDTKLLYGKENVAESNFIASQRVSFSTYKNIDENSKVCNVVLTGVVIVGTF